MLCSRGQTKRDLRAANRKVEEQDRWICASVFEMRWAGLGIQELLLQEKGRKDAEKAKQCSHPSCRTARASATRCLKVAE